MIKIFLKFKNDQNILKNDRNTLKNLKNDRNILEI